MALLGGEAPERCRRSRNIAAFGVKLLDAWPRSLAFGSCLGLPQSCLYCLGAIRIALRQWGPPGAPERHPWKIIVAEAEIICRCRYGWLALLPPEAPGTPPEATDPLLYANRRYEASRGAYNELIFESLFYTIRLFYIRSLLYMKSLLYATGLFQ